MAAKCKIMVNCTIKYSISDDMSANNFGAIKAVLNYLQFSSNSENLE